MDNARRFLTIDVVAGDDGKEHVVCEFVPDKRKLAMAIASALMNDTALSDAIYSAVVMTAERTGRKGRLLGDLAGMGEKKKETD